MERGADGTDGAFTETITADEIGLIYSDDGAIDLAMSEQKSSIWPIMMIARNLKKESQALPTEYDGEKAENVISDLQAFDKKAAVNPVDSQLVIDDEGAHVSEAVSGNTLDYEAAGAALVEALDLGSTEIDLNEKGLYLEPAIIEADPQLNIRAEALNKVLGAKVTLNFEDRSETIGSEEIVDRFLSLDMDGAYYIDEEKVYSYVESLAEKFDTYYGYRTFYTSLGTTVELSGGDYGWQLDQAATYDLLLNALREGTTGTLEPVYSHTAFSRGVNDIGDTYIEIDITNQRMWCYRNGMLVVDTPVVTGNPYRQNETPAGGVWEVDGMFRNAVLKGRGYSTPVSYWIPFNGNVGIHDLSSRYYFGGTIYKGYGSHGCVNTPLPAIKLIFNSIISGTPVIVYEDESDEALAQQTGSLDIYTITAQIEERYGTVDDAGNVIPGETEAVITDDGNKGELD